MDKLDFLELLELRMGVNDRFKAKILFLLLNNLDLANVILQLFKPIRDKSRLLLQIHALIREGSLML